MKKLLVVAAVAAFTMSSCKKDYTCTCKDNTTPPEPDVTFTYKKAKKKDAQKNCDAQNATYAIIDYSCTLK